MSSSWRAGLVAPALAAGVLAACGLAGSTAHQGAGGAGVGGSGASGDNVSSTRAASTHQASSSAASTGSGGSGGTGASSSSGGSGGSQPVDVIIEAEAFDSTTSPMERWSEMNAIPGASGGNYMQCGPDDGNFCDATMTPQSCAELDYNVTLAAHATYWFQVRMYATDGSQNSIWYAIDNAVNATPIEFETFDTWVWNTGASYPLTAGHHTITIYQRECGASVDELALTTTSAPPN